MSADVESCPAWLNALHETGDARNREQPVLSSSEWLLLQKVRSMSLREFGANTSSVNSNAMTKQLSDLVMKIEELVTCLKTCERSRLRFQHNYQNWRPVRDRNIGNLRRIANAIKKKKEEANLDRKAGNLMSVIGGVAAFALRRHPVTAMLVGGIALLGKVVASGASIGEAELTEEKLKEAKSTMDADRMYFDAVWSWFADSSALQDLIDEILQEIFRNIQGKEKLMEEIKSIVSANSKNMQNVEDKIENMLKYLKVSPKFKKEMSDVVSILMIIFIIKDHYWELFMAVMNGIKTKGKLNAEAERLFLFLHVWQGLTNCIVVPKKSVVILSVFFDVINFVKNSVEIDKGSPSTESENILKIADILENEASNLEEIYLQMIY